MPITIRPHTPTGLGKPAAGNPAPKKAPAQRATMSAAESQVVQKRDRLRELKARLRPGRLAGLNQAQRIDITYTSNALEGNTLTAGETALVIEKGIAIGGKPLREHMEAIDHAQAFDWIVERATNGEPLAEVDILSIHEFVVARSNPAIAGQYATLDRYVNTDAGLSHFPAPAEVPGHMGIFWRLLPSDEPTAELAFLAHSRLMSIHPFNDGNGRVSRLLMNLILMRTGYPPIAIRIEDRPAYITALHVPQRSPTANWKLFADLMYQRLDFTLDLYIRGAEAALA